MDIDELASSSSSSSSSSAPSPPAENNKPQRSVIVETLSESFLISPQSDSCSNEDAKENKIDGSVVVSKPSGRRYTIALIPREPAGEVEVCEGPGVGVVVTQSEEASSFEDMIQKDAGVVVNVGGNTSSDPSAAAAAVTSEGSVSKSSDEKTLSVVEGKPPSGDVEMVEGGVGSSGEISVLERNGLLSANLTHASIGTKQIKGSDDKKGSGEDKDTNPCSSSTTPDVPAESSTFKARSHSSSSPCCPFKSSLSSSTSKESNSNNKQKGKGKGREVEELQRDLAEDNFDFTEDGVSVLSGKAENGMRRGWKIEVRSWRWAEGRTVL